MTRSRKICLAVVIVLIPVVGAGGWVAYSIVHTLRHIPEAYAAWDTGTLLIEYMKQHEDRWPASWDELLAVLDSEGGRQIPLRGSHAGDIAYARSLSKTVVIDWSFDPAHPDGRAPSPRAAARSSASSGRAPSPTKWSANTWRRGRPRGHCRGHRKPMCWSLPAHGLS
jgi:hypothetical protein